jgi:hypothetical protein
MLSLVNYHKNMGSITIWAVPVKLVFGIYFVKLASDTYETHHGSNRCKLNFTIFHASFSMEQWFNLSTKRCLYVQIAESTYLRLLEGSCSYKVLNVRTLGF